MHGKKGCGIRRTYFPNCFFLYAVSFAVQGLMIVSEGEMYAPVPPFPALYTLVSISLPTSSSSSSSSSS